MNSELLRNVYMGIIIITSNPPARTHSFIRGIAFFPTSLQSSLGGGGALLCFSWKFSAGAFTSDVVHSLPIATNLSFTAFILRVDALKNYHLLFHLI